MVDKPIEKMNKDELIAFIKQHIEKLGQLQSETAQLTDFINTKWPEIQEFSVQANYLYSSAKSSANSAKQLLSKAKVLEESTTHLKTEAQQKHADITELHQKLFGSTDENGETSTGMSQELNDFFEDAKSKIEANEKAIEKHKTEIEKWWRTAITVNIAVRDKSAKDEHKRSSTFYSIGFFGSLLTLVFLNLLVPENFLAPANADFWDSLLAKASFNLPLAWWAWHCQRAIAEAQRIAEEYRHKQRVMELYVALTEEGGDFSAQEKKTELEKILLGTMQENPAKQVKAPSMPGLLGKVVKNKGD